MGAGRMRPGAGGAGGVGSAGAAGRACQAAGGLGPHPDRVRQRDGNLAQGREHERVRERVEERERKARDELLAREARLFHEPGPPGHPPDDAAGEHVQSAHLRREEGSERRTAAVIGRIGRSGYPHKS